MPRRGNLSVALKFTLSPTVFCPGWGSPDIASIYTIKGLPQPGQSLILNMSISTDRLPFQGKKP